MYNLLISLAAGVAVTVAFGFLFGGDKFIWYYGLVPGLITLVGAYIYLARRSFKQVQEIVQKAQPQIEAKNIDKGIEFLKEAYPIGKWQFLVKAQIDSQIGSILFMSKRFDEAEKYLRHGFKKSWNSQAMLAVLYYKRKDYEKMKEVFEEAVVANKKESLLWNLYAYCLWKMKKPDEAIDVLNRAMEALPEEDEKTARNLKALKNNRKMKMRGWGMQWYQFHLDRPPMQQRQVQFRG